MRRLMIVVGVALFAVYVVACMEYAKAHPTTTLCQECPEN